MTTRQLLEAKRRQAELLTKHIKTLEQMVAEEEGPPARPKIVPRAGRGGKPLGRGGLSAKVLQYLRDHPGTQTTRDMAAQFDCGASEVGQAAISLSRSGRVSHIGPGEFQLGPKGAAEEPAMTLAKV